jgi:hypothetical protein
MLRYPHHASLMFEGIMRRPRSTEVAPENPGRIHIDYVESTLASGFLQIR